MKKVAFLVGSGFKRFFPNGDNPVVFENPEFVVLNRHHSQVEYYPHAIPYLWNNNKLKELGVTDIFSFNTVGAIEEQLSNGDIVIPNDLINYTAGRKLSIFKDTTTQGERLHVDFTNPFTKELQCVLEKHLLVKVPSSGNFVCAVTNGPRFETPAEIRRMKKDGCHIVNMTLMPEAIFARESGMRYACASIVVNPAAGYKTEVVPADVDEVIGKIWSSFPHISKEVV